MEQEHKIDVKQALRVFNRITREGQKEGDQWRYRGLTASADFDGYTVFIKSAKVALTIFFHNKYSVEYSSARDLQEFVDLLQILDRD
ncbi:DUF3081 domain-containing protein [Microbulbifer thermotolerans]|uniref:DUF3081 domain-containing protein n=1 Tax=Microbulbifer thermotolerans TaxID=252514 RepID=A0AB35HZI9_MICTH|nr:DUF3081 family protein [Microbulbifer thermotolerans]MCX2780373.1 DUF3081 domain-containing protein [Microbulbifer thermotolerans]MCX2782505.1 DUF3081 domain-containing protein [Microbulbifer thermotolerans]MCX2802206.1 DUF3081 domain-containing protein [Microbulbifer thermotolerans]MCX2805955.1 DUF3081 domain-containing protein [Microbulbifer thermotolerans]MCX2832641.1 DUF3081 domain-containing protein [Microbulbifer thermotolerans]